MRNQYSNFLFLLLFLATQFSFAQDHKDCETALVICGESPFVIENVAGEGEPEDDLLTTCVLGESTSVWIKWTIVEGGDLTFELKPNDENQDLDFLVFKFNTENDCDDKELIRCMASGENAGTPLEEWERCTGSTGLAAGEVDMEEGPGCQKTDSNFLAPIESSTGDQYLLMVNDFSSTALGFELSFGGNAVVECITVPVSDVAIQKQFEINPTISNGTIQLKFENERYLNGDVFIHDLNGQKIFTIENVSQFGYDIDLTNFPSGLYLASFQKNDVFVTKKFMIQH